MGILDISRLSTDERLDLIGELWDSLHPDAVGLSAGQMKELEGRLVRFDAEKGTALPWADVEAALFERCLNGSGASDKIGVARSCRGR